MQLQPAVPRPVSPPAQMGQLNNAELIFILNGQIKHILAINEKNTS
jgi:hypothetical protein